jgi:hypothetical protein
MRTESVPIPTTDSTREVAVLLDGDRIALVLTDHEGHRDVVPVLTVPAKASERRAA